MRIAHAPRMYWPQHSSSLVPPTRCLVTAGCACQRHRLAWLMSAKPCKSTMNRFRCFNNMAFNRPGRTCLGRRTAAPNFRNGVRPFVLRYSSSQVRYSSSDLGLGASWAFGRGAVGSRGGPAAAGPSRSGRRCGFALQTPDDPERLSDGREFHPLHTAQQRPNLR
eukprot:CAMPEP_0175325030 /NCGR_PEP_ID=MMETSP0093-20121207/73798_1 /TAXON_ID=311494 /ORGANISM="Alexandrium monilatum, Strain CCMP3105" /LENGTH=164 /DNA_ID=CAMNT_0016621973 /DNA_START=143 /DNA_END=634 /DNA_ORIENTATION=+